MFPELLQPIALRRWSISIRNWQSLDCSGRRSQAETISRHDPWQQQLLMGAGCFDAGHGQRSTPNNVRRRSYPAETPECLLAVRCASLLSGILVRAAAARKRRL